MVLPSPSFPPSKKKTKTAMPTRAPHGELMQRALEEAERARGRTSPNPLVGCVIARGQRIIAVGHHARAGEAHAEVAALRRAGTAARGADVYVTLEPCNHHGRTGPCTEALIAAQVKRVFVGARDPNPVVNGRGIRRLRAAGIEVHTGVLAAECRQLNEAFEWAMGHRRPWVVAKLAQSLDGRVATRTGESQWITSPAARRAGHALRNSLDAILVGVGTVRADDPALTCRLRGGRDPIRVVLDTHASLSPTAAVVRLGQTSKAPTWICVAQDAPARRRLALERAGAETLVCKVTGTGQLEVDSVLEQLLAREVLSVLVEGGPQVLGSFFDAQAVNKVVAFVAPRILGGKAARLGVEGLGVAHLRDALELTWVSTQAVGPDLMLVGQVKGRAP